jgi:hypothetical protein
MTKLIRNFTLGSCGLHIPQSVLTGLRFLTYPFAKLGFTHTPFALSSGAAIQLHEFCLGERSLPEAVRMLAYMDPNQPTPATRRTVEGAEIALVELSTSIEPLIGDAVVNFNRVSDFVLKPLRGWGMDPRLVNNFSNSLFHLRDDVEERRRIVLDNWPHDSPDDGSARFAVENLQSRRVGVDDMVRDLEHLRERLQIPMVLKLYDFRYMPDARALEWPAGFKTEQVEVARRMGLPTLSLTPIVQHLGVKRVIADDMMHWREDTSPIQAQAIYDILADVLGRPRLDSYAESANLRRQTEAAFPELLEMGTLIDFPCVANIPERARAAGAGGRARAVAPDELAADELADRLNRVLLALHRGRLHELGVVESGLGPHYQTVLGLEMLVGLREERTLDLLLQDLPAYDAYAVMRAGLGELAVLIAASGRRTIAFEPNAARRGAIEAGRIHLEEAGLLAPGVLSVVGTLTPREALEGRVLGVGLDVVQFIDEAAAAPHLERLATFEALLIVPRTFLRLRSDAQEQEQLARSLVDLGFDGRRDYPGDALSWFYRSGDDGATG